MAHDLCSASTLVGCRIYLIARVFFEFQGSLEQVDGPLEITVSGRSVLFDCEGDGESLRVRERCWNDPFEGELSADNRQFVESSGRWRRTEVSDWQGYRDLKGHVITEIQLLTNQHGRVAGVRFAANNRFMWFVVEGDECRVHWSAPMGFYSRRD